MLRHRIEALMEQGRERGAVMVVFALMLIVLFGFMAISVDLSYAYTQRRESQSIADVAAVGGALQAIDNSGTSNQVAGDVVNKVMDIAAKNLGAGLDWASCADPDRFAVSAADIFILGNDPQYTDCISWTSDFSAVRVRIPDRQIETFFGKVIGFDSVTVGAFAEVSEIIGGGGGVLPFGLLGGGNEGLICLKTGPQFPSECDPNVSGNFNYLDFRVYGNSALGTISNGCSGGVVSTLKENIAHGIDHDLAPAPATPLDHLGIKNDANIVKDDVQCPDNTKDVQAALTETGNKQKVLIDGFVNGVNGFPGRLTLGSPSRVYNFGGVDIDDVGLWSYLRPDMDPDPIGFAPNPCANTGVYAQSEAGIIKCIADFGTEQIFSQDIGTSARLARVPKLWQTTWPSGTKYLSFKGFTYVYIQTLYGGCKNNGNCSLEYAPDETDNYTSADPVVITAIVIPDVTLSTEVRANFGVPRVTTYAITR